MGKSTINGHFQQLCQFTRGQQVLDVLRLYKQDILATSPVVTFVIPCDTHGWQLRTCIPRWSSIFIHIQSPTCVYILDIIIRIYTHTVYIYIHTVYSVYIYIYCAYIYIHTLYIYIYIIYTVYDICIIMCIYLQCTPCCQDLLAERRDQNPKDQKQLQVKKAMDFPTVQLLTIGVADEAEVAHIYIYIDNDRQDKIREDKIDRHPHIYISIYISHTSHNCIQCIQLYTCFSSIHLKMHRPGYVDLKAQMNIPVPF